jgi:hypothetical protein
MALDWAGQQFVFTTDGLDTNDNLARPDYPPNKDGWQTVWKCQTHISFRIADVLAVSQT